jgi:hypothetical protein
VTRFPTKAATRAATARAALRAIATAPVPTPIRLRAPPPVIAGNAAGISAVIGKYADGGEGAVAGEMTTFGWREAV